MQTFSFARDHAQSLTQHGSHHVWLAHILSAASVDNIVCAYIEAGGVIARHLAATEQLFLVVQGEGWVSGEQGIRHSIRSGQAVMWETGEEHESGSKAGMMAIIIEGTGLRLAI